MPRHSEFVEFVIEQMTPIGGLRVRAMFGGYGIYQDDLMIAIIEDDRLYFKADHATRDDFEVRGLGPFTYIARGKSVTLQYFEAPPEVFEDTEEMRSWVRKAHDAAVRAGKNKVAVRRGSRDKRNRRHPGR